MALRTCSTVSSATGPVPLTTRLTVEIETPAKRATSEIVARRVGWSVFTIIRTGVDGASTVSGQYGRQKKLVLAIAADHNESAFRKEKKRVSNAANGEQPETHFLWFYTGFRAEI